MSTLGVVLDQRPHTSNSESLPLAIKKMLKTLSSKMFVKNGMVIKAPHLGVNKSLPVDTEKGSLVGCIAQL